jgi:uncharacterized protein
MSDPFIPAELRGTSLEMAIRALDDVYARAETAMTGFRRASGVDCLGGCGECCKGFEPDIRTTEAAYLAAWLQGPGAEKLPMLSSDDGSGTCPFFDADDPRHCQVYPARFLICRLFGYCAMRGKAGELDYSLCFAIARTGRFPRKQWSAGQLEEAFGALPPIMSDFGNQAAAIEPEGIGRPEPVRAAMRVALAKVGLAISMGRSAIIDEEPDLEDGRA